MDELTALRVFRLAAELGSFAETARRLRMSPAAVSKNISDLEAQLAVRLINRTTRRMSLTEAGTLYFQRVVRVLDDLREANASVGALHDAPSGLLRVNAPVTLTVVALSRSIPAFLDRYPNISLDLDLNDRRIDLVKEGHDVAIRGSDVLEDSSLVARKLMVLSHVLCGAPAYFERCGIPREPTELHAHQLVQFSLSGHAQAWTFRKDEDVARIPVEGRYRVSSSLAVRDALRAGFGLSLIPRIYVHDDLVRGDLRAVLDGWSADETSIYAVYPSRRHLAPKLRVFLDFLASEFGRYDGPDANAADLR
jgi:DNA-binding transcriptional LysR family regulator